MAITKTWQVNTLERDVSDGHVNKVIYRVKGIDGSEEKSRETGEVNFTKPSSLPSDFVAYDSLSESTVLGWVKTALGTDQVASIEAKIDADIALINTPVTAVGKPWS
tara:strand:+ start:604 stop:924 length:321 start_codon:yes stop_codon:yes gene_type:complete